MMRALFLALALASSGPFLDAEDGPLESLESDLDASGYVIKDPGATLQFGGTCDEGADLACFAIPTVFKDDVTIEGTLTCDDDASITGDLTVGGGFMVSGSKLYGPESCWHNVSSEGVNGSPPRTHSWQLTDDTDYMVCALQAPNEWDGASNLVARPIWSSINSSAIANGETVEFDYRWYKVAAGKIYSSATQTTGTATYTQSGAGVAGEAILSTTFTIDYDHADNPLSRGNVFFLTFRHLSTGTYDGGTSEIVFQGLLLEWQ